MFIKIMLLCLGSRFSDLYYKRTNKNNRKTLLHYKLLVNVEVSLCFTSMHIGYLCI